MHRPNFKCKFILKDYIYFTYLFFISAILVMACVLHVENKLKK